MTTGKTDAVVDEVASLAAQGQGVESLTYPVGVKKPGAPGILTAVLPKVGDPRGQPVRYFLEGKLSPLARMLALLDMVSAQTVVEGIESQIVMIDMMPETERVSEVTAAQARLVELDGLILLLSVEGQAPYAERIAAEREALCRLLDAAGQPYVPEVAKSEAESLMEAERAVDGLLGIAERVKLSEPLDVTAAAEAQVQAALAAARKGSK